MSKQLEEHSEHALDKLVDVGLAVAGLAALVEVQKLLAEAAKGAGQLERPQEVVGLCEVWPNGDDLVDKVLHADDAVLAEASLHDLSKNKRLAHRSEQRQATLTAGNII